MVTVTSSVDLVAVTPQAVWSVVSDSAGMVRRAAHVHSVVMDGDVARWTVSLNGSRIQWEQREHAEPPHCLTFEQVTGDLDELRGTWTVRALETGVRVRLEIAFHLGVDGLAPLLDPIWAQSFHFHADALVQGVAYEIGTDQQ